MWIHANRHSLIFKCSGQQKQPFFYSCRHRGLPFPLCPTICTCSYTHTHTCMHTCTHTERRRKERGILDDCLGRKAILSNGPLGRRWPLLFSCLFPFHFPLYLAALTIRAIISFIHSTTMYLFFIMWWDLGQVSSTKDIRVKKK